MTVLQDHQFEILTNEDSASGVPFGMGQPISCLPEGFDTGQLAPAVQDVQDPQSGAIRFGRNVIPGNLWTWSLFVNQHSELDALDALDDLQTAWRDSVLTDKLGGVSVLRYQIAGRVRRVFGQARRFAAPPTNLLLAGMVNVTCDFQLSDSLYYGDTLETDTLDLVAESSGGVVYPVVYPLTGLPSGNNEGELFVGGKVATWPIIRITGPVTDPELITPGWTLKLLTTIEEDDWIEIDTRPWARTVLNQDGQSVAGIMDPKVRMRTMSIQPGNQSFAYRGSSATMTSTCIIKRYPAYASL